MEALPGKTVLVTGGGARLGRAVSLACADAGLRVAVHFKASETGARATASEIRAGGGRAEVFFADLRMPEGAAHLTAAVSAWSPPDYVVCCHGGYTENALSSFTVSELADEVALTFASHLFVSRAWYRIGGRGAAVHLVDARTTDYDRKHAAYHLAKRALAASVRASAVELAPRVRVNGVSPGLVLPPEQTDERFLASAANAALLGRIGSPAAVTRAVLFLLTSDFITGQVIYVDGGRNLKGSVY